MCFVSVTVKLVRRLPVTCTLYVRFNSVHVHGLIVQKRSNVIGAGWGHFRSLSSRVSEISFPKCIANKRWPKNSHTFFGGLLILTFFLFIHVHTDTHGPYDMACTLNGRR